MNHPSDFMGWQQDFIAKNLLIIGYNAWVGYLAGERGVLICSTRSPAVGVAGETFKASFVPRSRLAAFLNAWLAAPDTVILRHHFMNAHILEVVDTYEPATEVVFFLESFHQVTFFYLKNLPMSPPQCYERISKEWEEFSSQSTHGLKKTSLSRVLQPEDHPDIIQQYSHLGASA